MNYDNESDNYDWKLETYYNMLPLIRHVIKIDEESFKKEF